MLMDYHKYQFSLKEWILYIMIYLIIDIGISIVFYHSWIAALVFIPGILFYIKEQKKQLIKKRKQRLTAEFLCGMQGVSTALTAGYSIENAFGEALKELKKVYEPETMIVREFRYIVNRLSMNQNLENLLLDLGRRSGIEDIYNFAEVLSAAKRSGGDLNAIIRHTVAAIHQKEETKREIEVCIASKRLEQNIMSLIPFLILIYIDLASPGFLNVMYHNILGILVMSICLAVYLISWLLGRKIVDIEV